MTYKYIQKDKNSKLVIGVLTAVSFGLATLAGYLENNYNKKPKAQYKQEIFYDSLEQNAKSFDSIQTEKKKQRKSFLELRPYE